MIFINNLLKVISAVLDICPSRTEVWKENSPNPKVKETLLLFSGNRYDKNTKRIDPALYSIHIKEHGITVENYSVPDSKQFFYPIGLYLGGGERAMAKDEEYTFRVRLDPQNSKKIREIYPMINGEYFKTTEKDFPVEKDQILFLNLARKKGMLDISNESEDTLKKLPIYEVKPGKHNFKKICKLFKPAFLNFSTYSSSKKQLLDFQSLKNSMWSLEQFDYFMTVQYKLSSILGFDIEKELLFKQQLTEFMNDPENKNSPFKSGFNIFLTNHDHPFDIYELFNLSYYQLSPGLVKALANVDADYKNLKLYSELPKKILSFTNNNPPTAEGLKNITKWLKFSMFPGELSSSTGSVSSNQLGKTSSTSSGSVISFPQENSPLKSSNSQPQSYDPLESNLLEKKYKTFSDDVDFTIYQIPPVNAIDPVTDKQTLVNRVVNGVKIRFRREIDSWKEDPDKQPNSSERNSCSENKTYDFSFLESSPLIGIAILSVISSGLYYFLF